MTERDAAVEFAIRVAREEGHLGEVVDALPEVIDSALSNGATVELGEGSLSLRWPVAGVPRPLLLLYVDQSACLELNFHRPTDPALGDELERRLRLALPQSGGTPGKRPNYSLRALRLPDSRIALYEVFAWLGTRTQSVTRPSLDQLLSDDRLQAWVDGSISLDDRDATRFDLAQQRAEGLPRFDELSAHHDWPAVQEAIRTYILQCLPFPRRSEWSHWVISAMPSTGRTARWRRLCVVSVNQMETLVIGQVTEGSSTELTAFVNVSRSRLLSRGETQAAFLARMNAAVDLSETDYRAAQGDSIGVDVEGASGLAEILRDGRVLEAARHLNLHLMRRGETSYHSSHCFPLADIALVPSAEGEKRD